MQPSQGSSSQGSYRDERPVYQVNSSGEILLPQTPAQREQQRFQRAVVTHQEIAQRISQQSGARSGPRLPRVGLDVYSPAIMGRTEQQSQQAIDSRIGEVAARHFSNSDVSSRNVLSTSDTAVNENGQSNTAYAHFFASLQQLTPEQRERAVILTGRLVNLTANPGHPDIRSDSDLYQQLNNSPYDYGGTVSVSGYTVLRDREIQRLPVTSDYNTLNIALLDLNNRPEKVLDQLTAWFSRNSHFPRIQFIDAEGRPSKGADFGGLSRHLVSTLFSKLFKDSGSEATPGDATSDKLFFYRDHDSRQVLPMAVAFDSRESERWKTIGKLFACACRDNLLTGPYFSPKLFSALSVLLGPKKSLADGTSLLPLLALLKLTEHYSYVEKALNDPSSLSEEEKKQLDELCSNDQLTSEDPQSKVFTAFELAIAEESMKGGLPYLKIKPALLSIAEGMKSMGFNFFATAADLQRRIQGEITPSIILESLDFINPPKDFERFPENANAPNLLRGWIGKASPEDLARFLKAVTGLFSLVPGAIKLKVSYDRHHPNGLPIAQTCLYHLQLPEHDTPQKQPGKQEPFATLQESFAHSMKLFLDYSLAGTGFTLT